MGSIKGKPRPPSTVGSTSGSIARRAAENCNSPITGGGFAEVFLIKAADRDYGVRSLMRKFNLEGYRGKTVAIKANFNSADPFPASTHIHTLASIVRVLKDAGASEVVMAERSGMGETRKVLEEAGVMALSKELGFRVVVLDEEGRDAWVKVESEGTHWSRGFYISRIFLEADRVVQTCCLKTHRFGGHFSSSLKNSVGLIADCVPGIRYGFMSELHNSRDQRLMIAEINGYYRTDIVVMDAIKAFIRGGPDMGEIVEPGIIMASSDRVAIDAVGVSILRRYGSTNNVMKGNIFALEQLYRAAELGIGVGSPSLVRITPLDKASRGHARKAEGLLLEHGIPP